MSDASPRHATSTTSSGRWEMTTRAPWSPVAGSSGHTDAPRRTGCRRRPSYVATAMGDGLAATAVQASGGARPADLVHDLRARQALQRHLATGAEAELARALGQLLQQRRDEDLAASGLGCDA